MVCLCCTRNFDRCKKHEHLHLKYAKVVVLFVLTEGAPSCTMNRAILMNESFILPQVDVCLRGSIALRCTQEVYAFREPCITILMPMSQVRRFLPRSLRIVLHTFV